MTRFASAFLLGLFALAAPAAHAETPTFTLTIKDHKFEPATLEVPAGEKVKLSIVNNDPTAEEFESHKLNREKVIPGNSTGTVFIGPLEPGSYPFVGEFNEDTAKGTIIAKQ